MNSGKPDICSSRFCSALYSGALIEPMIHPKPGAVTRLESHADKSLYDFMVHAIALSTAAHTACNTAYNGSGDPIASGFKAYRSALQKLGIKTNIGLGTALLLVPLAAALGDLGYPANPQRLAERASNLIIESSTDAVREYYDLLSMLSPSHLRQYHGPIPGVGKGYPRSFRQLLEIARWDIVHDDVRSGYPRSLQAKSLYAKALHEYGDIDEAGAHTLLYILSEYGDTLILAKYGIRAYLKALKEAKEAIMHTSKPSQAVALLDSLWRPRNWNPGAALDILATGISLFYYESMD